VLVGLPQGVGGLVLLFICFVFILFKFYSFCFVFILVKFILFKFSFHIVITHYVLVGLPQGVGSLAFLFYFNLFYFYNTHQVLVGLPQRGWWPCYFVLFHIILLL
jgi:hypothetical protein